MTVPPEHALLALDVVGIFVFAISGGLVGIRARLDLFGIAVLAWVTGLGGGIIRDVFLGDLPPVGISNPWYAGSVLAAGVVVVLLLPRLRELRRRNPDVRLGYITRLVKYLDAVGLAVFAVSGAAKAVDLGAPPLACVFVGGITAVGGGALRDVLVGQVPEVLRREVYAVPAVLGAVVVVLADALDALGPVVLVLSAALVFVMRVTAIVLDLNVPTPRPTGANP
ncbi:trimeric intracellular cation channel family protein [Ornithinimicrobium cerasi]|uniref:trimeric intracellular cation channel family protein n=1 Tax=Ornithinimicrobium cerasi TaxID=2248773 RepID=UPI000EFFC281|nr:TRIC cation channel family protein [Ornithinimicrobium cerasi]